MKAKKALSVLLAVVLACSMLATYALADSVCYDVWVGGVQVTSENMDDVLGDGTVKFTPGCGKTIAKLTLDGATINGKANVLFGAGIYSCDALEINTVSASTVNGVDCGCLISAAIADACNLTFTGSGKLNVNGPDVKLGSTHGIYSVAGTVRINGANVAATSGKACCNSFAVFAPTVIVNSGKLYAKGADYATDTVGIKTAALIINGGKTEAIGGIRRDNCPIFNQSFGICSALTTVKAGELIACGDCMAIFGALCCCEYKCPLILAGKCRDGSDACPWENCLLDLDCNCLCKYNWVKVCQAEYTLTFECNGGSPIDPITCKGGTCIDLSKYVPTKDGYKFCGWYLDKCLTIPVCSICLICDTTVYAKWCKECDPDGPTPPTPVDPEYVTVKIPFTKIVEQGKDADKPGKATFSFKVTGPEGLDFTVESASIETNGVGTYNGEIVLKVNKKDFAKLGKAGVTIKEESKTKWDCSADTWTVKFADVCGKTTFTFSKDDKCADKMAFTNVYTYKYVAPGDDVPDTGDDTHAMLLGLISLISLAGITAIVVSSKRKSFEK